MGRPRKWKDDAERKRHERGSVSSHDPGTSTRGPAESVVLDPAGADGPDLDPGAEELIEWEGKLWPAVHTQYVTEDEYAEAEGRITQGLLDRGLKDPDGKRVERAVRYARWRYRGWLVGEIRSL